MPPLEDAFDYLLTFPSAESGASPVTTSLVTVGQTLSTDPHQEVAAPREPLPDIDFDRVILTTAQPNSVHREASSTRGARQGLSGPGYVDFDARHRIQSEFGERGEATAYAVERKRVEGLGLSPDLVVWTSRTHQTAPYDISSVDDDGQAIYIEVKATSDSDPTSPFEISQAELLKAVEQRSRYYIYRVTDVDTEAPKVVRYQDPMALIEANAAELRLSGARLAFGPDAAMELSFERQPTPTDEQ